MTLFSVTGAAVAACALIVLLRENKPEISVLLSSACALLLLGASLTVGRPLLERLEELTGQADIKPEYLNASLRAVGVCFVTETGAELCRDGGQASLASKVELFGRLTVLTAALPVLLSIFELALEIIK